MCVCVCGCVCAGGCSRSGVIRLVRYLFGKDLRSHQAIIGWESYTMFFITDTGKAIKLTNANGEKIAFDIVEGWVHIAPVSLKRTYPVIHGENFLTTL